MCIFLTAYSDRSSDRCQQCSCPNLFRISTYEISRKCCNQRTYRIAKSFRFHTYKKHGGGGVMVNLHPSSERRAWQVFSHAGPPFRPRSQSVSTPDPKLTLCTDGSVAIGG